jgi:hypothetical protein
MNIDASTARLHVGDPTRAPVAQQLGEAFSG